MTTNELGSCNICGVLMDVVRTKYKTDTKAGRMVRRLLLKWEGLFSEQGETESLNITKPPETPAPKRTVREIFHLQRTQSGISVFSLEPN